MILCTGLPPIRDCTDPFRVGAELDVLFWLSAIHVYGTGSHGGEASLRQPSSTGVRPDLTFLRATVAQVDLVERSPGGGTALDKAKTSIRVATPIPLRVGFRRLQQSFRAIPTEVGQPVATLGFLGCIAREGAGSVRVRVEAVLALELEPASPTFGAWRSGDVWTEGQVDVSNLDETTVLVRLAVL